MKRIVALFLASVMTLGLLGGCTTAQNPGSQGSSSSGGNTSSGNTDKVVCGVVLIDMTNQFFVDMIEGGNKAAEDYGCGQVDVDTNSSTVYNDQENTRIIAEMTAKAIGEEGKTALLYGNKGNLVSDLRQQGYYEGMDKYPNITVVEQPTNWDPPTGMKAAQDLIAANPDLKAIHCVSGAVTLAVYQAVKTAGLEDQIMITSYDGNSDELIAVKDGQFYSTVLTGAKKTGYWNIQVALQLAAGARPENHVLNMDTHFVLNEEHIQDFKDMGIENTENVSLITPDEASKLAENYRDELYDPDLLK